MLLLLLGCAMVMLRPAHSLAKFEGGGTLGIDPDPATTSTVLDCLGVPDCELPDRSPVDLEYRIGLGRGWEIGARGLLPPRALSLKYALLDERRHPTLVSLALRAEGGAIPRTEAGTLSLLPFARADLLFSGTAPLSPRFALRPVASAGVWADPDEAGRLRPVFGWTAGLLLPFRLPGDLAMGPIFGVVGTINADGATAPALRLGLTVEPWLLYQSPRG